ncbi:MAG: hypothetical protein WA964_16465 [Ilumatobacter sp.]|uniref:hypothetical protein n=1 Tax=Ilumatobacter sp. TaxID=1967498 RepID=UPI003C774409
MSEADFERTRPAIIDGESAPALVESTAPPTLAARCCFALQAVAGAAWWIAVFASDDVRRWTLGSWSHELLVGPDVIFFVLASAAAAATANRFPVLVCSLWTTGVTVALVADALLRQRAG